MSAAEWVRRSRKIEKKRKQEEEEAKRRQAELDAQDDIFEDAAEAEVSAAGLRVLHKADAFDEGTTTILTLKDTNILTDKGDALNMEEDKLENEKMVATEKRKWDEKHKKQVYNVYDDMEGKVDTLLPQYNEGEREFKRDEGFTLNPEGEGTAEEKTTAILGKLKQSLNEIQLEPVSNYMDTLDVNGIKVQSEYYTPAEMTKFKKPTQKRSKGLRKKVKTKDLIKSLEEEAKKQDADADHSSRGRSAKLEADAEQALKALEYKQKAYKHAKQKAEESRKQLKTLSEEALKEEEMAAAPPEDVKIEGEDEEGNIIFDPTEEFCKHISKTSILFQRDEDDEEGETKVKKEAASDDEEGDDDEKKAKKKIKKEEEEEEYKSKLQEPLLQEPMAKGGLSDVLELIRQKGFIDRSYMGRQNDRVVDVSKADPAPQIKLLYQDEQTGQEMTQKEAFRRISWKFHSKVPGKAKQEKRMKKQLEEMKTKSMTDVDTPLRSVEALRHCQATTRQAHIVIQGGNTDLGITSGVKKTKDSKREKRKGDAAAGSESTLNLKRAKF
eukprot:TRINITY_DN67231_c12_g2_i1.p1 TRINITY_DN67231_c12_g2~~TRINITY_DN67231_c12_g2_i1.p1  ORF type:complete len:632 (-),score=106.65 TRINITY_DN67231_c12_g2_i1:544-2202(-)